MLVQELEIVSVMHMAWKWLLSQKSPQKIFVKLHADSKGMGVGLFAGWSPSFAQNPTAVSRVTGPLGWFH